MTGRRVRRALWISLLRTVQLALLGGVVAAQEAPAPLVFTDLHDVNAGGGDLHNFNSGKLAQARDGKFYIEAQSGGVSSQGGIASFSTVGTMLTAFSFNGGTTGALPTGGLTLGQDGLLYGNTQGGGTGNNGITFKVTTSGTYTSLHNFTNTGDGYGPVNALVLGTDGNFYGLTNSNPETFYKVTSAGVLTTLHTFTNAEGLQGGQLIQGSDGNFYGGLNQGGNGWGTLFKATATGTVTVLHTFAIGGSDGANAGAGMAQAPNGVLFGVTYSGGTNGIGVLYKVTPTGTYTVLRNFTSATDGANPWELSVASDGNIYGVTVNGGTNGCGTLFKVTQAGAFSVLFNFASATGCNPASALTQGTDGKLYGVTNTGGANNNGTFFSADLALPAFVTLLPTAGKAGSKIGILGQGFSSSSVVKFNGVQATAITLTGTTFITATVPAGASNGFVTVTTGATTLTSSKKFTVHDSWSSGAAIPTARAGGAIGVIGTKVYVVSGETSSAIVGNNEIYNLTTNTWTTGAPIPTPRFVPASAVVNNILYVMGGITDSTQTPVNVVEAYNPATNSWSTKTPMPTTDDSMNAIVLNNLIYVVGGYTAGNRTAMVQVYNPATDTWSTAASLLQAKSDSALGLLGTKIISTGGFVPGNVPTGDTELYNAGTNSWSAVAADPTPRTGGCGASVGGVMYEAGGTPGNANISQLNESYNSTKNAWTTLSNMPVGVTIALPAVSGGQLYCFGGTSNGNLFQGTTFNNVQIYQP